MMLDGDKWIDKTGACSETVLMDETVIEECGGECRNYGCEVYRRESRHVRECQGCCESLAEPQLLCEYFEEDRSD